LHSHLAQFSKYAYQVTGLRQLNTGLPFSFGAIDEITPSRADLCLEHVGSIPANTGADQIDNGVRHDLVWRDAYVQA
jgi:hypothetical protein